METVQEVGTKMLIFVAYKASEIGRDAAFVPHLVQVSQRSVYLGHPWAFPAIKQFDAI